MKCVMVYYAYLKLFADFVNEELPTVLFSVKDGDLFDLWSDRVHYLLYFVLREDVRDLSRGQKVVDQHEELKKVRVPWT